LGTGGRPWGPQGRLAGRPLTMFVEGRPSAGGDERAALVRKAHARAARVEFGISEGQTAGLDPELDER
jgi:hypothetical protein